MNRAHHGYQRRTSVWTVLASFSTALALFAIFRSTAEVLTVTWIGAWSLLQGLFLVARISDSGAGSNIARVVAVRVKEGSPLDLRSFTVACLVIASAPSVLLTVLTAPLIGLYVTHQFGVELNREELWALVWLALINSAVGALSNVMLAVCEGMFELNYKSKTVIASNLIGVSALLPVLNIAGPVGIGYAYIVISATQLVLASLKVIQFARPEPRIKSRAVGAHIRDLWRENLHLSTIALIRLSFEPVTKFLLSLFAPLIIIAQFELALRVTTQARIIVQSALQPLLALGARHRADADAGVRKLFERNERVLSTISIGLLVAQILVAPALQLLGMAFYEPAFVVFTAILAAGNAINTMGISGYYWQLASGKLSPLVRIQAAMAFANIAIGLLGRYIESVLVIVGGYSSAFMLGGLVSRAFLPSTARSTILAWACITLAAGGLASALALTVHPMSLSAVIALLLCGMSVAGASLYTAYLQIRRKN